MKLYVVVNTNPDTHHPTTGLPFDGNMCFRNGYQNNTIGQASIYWTEATAQRLADKLNAGELDKQFKKHHGLNFPNTVIPGQYKVQPYTLTPENLK